MTTSAVACAAEVHDRGDVAQHLLDRRSEQGPVGPEPLPLVGVVEEGDHRPGDEIAGGLVAGHRQQQEEEVEFELRELVPVDLRLGQDAERGPRWGSSRFLAQSSSA